MPAADKCRRMLSPLPHRAWAIDSGNPQDETLVTRAMRNDAIWPVKTAISTCGHGHAAQAVFISYSIVGGIGGNRIDHAQAGNVKGARFDAQGNALASLQNGEAGRHEGLLHRRRRRRNVGQSRAWKEQVIATADVYRIDQ